MTTSFAQGTLICAFVVPHSSRETSMIEGIVAQVTFKLASCVLALLACRAPCNAIVPLAFGKIIAVAGHAAKSTRILHGFVAYHSLHCRRGVLKGLAIFLKGSQYHCLVVLHLFGGISKGEAIFLKSSQYHFLVVLHLFGRIFKVVAVCLNSSQDHLLIVLHAC